MLEQAGAAPVSYISTGQAGVRASLLINSSLQPRQDTQLTPLLVTHHSRSWCTWDGGLVKKIKLVDDQHCQFLIIVFAEQASGTLFKKKVVGERGWELRVGSRERWDSSGTCREPTNQLTTTFYRHYQPLQAIPLNTSPIHSCRPADTNYSNITAHW